MTMTGSSLVTIRNANLQIGVNSGSGTLNMGTSAGSDTPSIDTDGWIYVGRSSGAGVLNMYGKSTITTRYAGSGSIFAIGSETGTVTTSALNMYDNATINIKGYSMYVGYGNSTSGVKGTGALTLNGNSRLNLDTSLCVGYDSAPSSTTLVDTGTVTVAGTGSEIYTRANIIVGYADKAVATWNQNAGLTCSIGAGFYFGTYSGCTSTLNLNGGTLQVMSINMNAASPTDTINFNGGILQANASTSSFVNIGTLGVVNVKAGGAKVDTNGFSIQITNVLATWRRHRRRPYETRRRDAHSVGGKRLHRRHHDPRRRVGHHRHRQSRFFEYYRPKQRHPHRRRQHHHQVARGHGEHRRHAGPL